MNSSTISTSPEAEHRSSDAMPNVNPTDLRRQIPGTRNPKTAIMMTTYRVLQEDRELPRTYIINTLDAQKHIVLHTISKYKNWPKEE